ncbi:hypothetical protein [Runella zeae]|uniref:hypothetical protein n=1 Tax=Runella zeae TaxID=94255 RepID=UPI002354297A|nr:hypothetical protein [Runella zeae]
MKKILLIWMLPHLFLYRCMAQGKLGQGSQDFLLTVEFYPSFNTSSRLVIQKKGNLQVLSISYLYPENSKDTIAKVGLKVESSDSLLLDKESRRFYQNKVFVKPLEKIAVSPKSFKKFCDTLSSIDLSMQSSLVKKGSVDGISVGVRYVSGTTDHFFSLKNPTSRDTQEHRIIKAIFGLMESGFKTETTLRYIELLRGYFNFGLLVRKVSQTPLEYRFYSHLSANESEEFYKLMKSLPRNKLLIFDFSNFIGMGTMFYGAFRELIAVNKEVYWLVNESSVIHVEGIGAKPDKIFTNREKLLKFIKQRRTSHN